MLQAFHVLHVFGRGVVRELHRRLVIVSQQRPQTLQPASNDLEHGRRGIRRQLLRQRGDAQTGLTPDLAAIGVQLIGQQTQQGGLARTVAANQANPFAGVQLKAGAIQQLFSAEGDGEMVNAE